MRPTLLLFLCLSVFCATAQDSSRLRNRSFKIYISQPDTTLLQGWLANVTDSSVVVSSAELWFPSRGKENATLKEFKYHQIDFAQLKKPHGGLRGFGIGLLAGFAGGALIGFASGDDKSGIVQFTAVEKALAGGIFLGAIAGVTGAIIGGLAKKTFHIKRNKPAFDVMHDYINQKAYRTN